MGAGEPSSLRLVFSLGIAGLLAGLLLVGVFLGTKPRIDQNRAEALQRAIVRVLWPDGDPNEAHRIESRVLRDGRLVTPEGPLAAGERVAYLGFDAEGQPLGYAIPAAGKGFQDDIELLYGFDASSDRIVGFEVLAHRETPGLGDKIEKDAAFVGRFRSLLVLPQIDAVRSGEGDQDFEVECITGATISSKAVVRILNESMQLWRPAIHETSGVASANPSAPGRP